MTRYSYIALLVTMLWIPASGKAQEPSGFADELRARIGKETEIWIGDASKLGFAVEVPSDQRIYFQQRFLTKVREFAKDPSRLVRYGQQIYTSQARNLILEKKVLEPGQENAFWIQAAYWRGLSETGETVRNLYFSILIDTIRREGLKPRISVRPSDRASLFDCDAPPYSKWYCAH